MPGVKDPSSHDCSYVIHLADTVPGGWCECSGCTYREFIPRIDNKDDYNRFIDLERQHKRAVLA